MKPRTLITIFVAVSLMLACNLPFVAANVPNGGSSAVDASATPEAGDTATPSVTPAPADTATPTLTPLPSETPTITPTPTPTVPTVTANDKGVNCRYGPSVGYESVGALAAFDSAPILGKSSDGNWWQITSGSSTNKCWVAGSVTTASGNLSLVPVVPAPAGLVKGVTVKVGPTTISVPGCMGPIQPISLKGTITVNGPVKVKYHFETQQGGKLSSHTVSFSAFGTETVTDSSYTPPLTPGSYWVRLVIESPSSASAEASYKITCP